MSHLHSRWNLRSRLRVRASAFAFAIALSSAPAGRAVCGEPSSLECEVLYTTVQGVYVDAGLDEGLRADREGWLEWRGDRVARVEVAEVSRGATFLRVVSRHAETLPAGGDRVVIVVVLDARSASTQPERPAGLRAPGEGDGFVPLLAPTDWMRLARVEPQNVLAGRAGVREIYQWSGDGDDDFSITRLGSSGSLERIDGTPWAFEWSGDLSYRLGDGLQSVRDHDDVRLEAYRLAFYRRFDDRSFVRFGRFVPRELPAIGFLDGAHVEKALSERMRAGALLGLTPARETLDGSVKEITAASYLSFELGASDGPSYSATVGALGSLWEGTPDRLALLVEQSARWEAFDVLSSSVIDFDAGGADVRSGTRLSRQNLLLSWDATETLSLRAGADHHEIPDTEAEREAIGYGFLAPDDYFDDGFWRYRAGFAWRLPASLRIDGEVSFTDSAETDDVLRWQLALTRTGIAGMPEASATLSAYRLDSVSADGIGARLSGAFPLVERRLYLQPAIALRFARYETSGAVFFDAVDESMLAVDFSIHAQWQVDRRWTATAGVSVAVTDEDERFLADVGVAYRF